MKIRLLLILFLSNIFLCFSKEIPAIVIQNVNVRWEPSSKSKIIKVFNKGKEIIILEEKKGWSFIKDPRKRSSSYNLGCI